MGVAMYPADERGCRVKLRDWETLCFTEYGVTVQCRSPADLTVAGCTRIELWCQRLRVECRSEFAVTFGATSCECDGYIFAVTKNAVTNSAVMLAVRLVSGFRISPAVAKL
jgi:hypothetical protein